VAIPVGQSGMIAIPQTAVIERGQLTGFYLIGKENIAHFRLLRTGQTLGEQVEVVSGLKEGDRYVIDPGPEMSDGVMVEVTS
jgi:multidrug efflux pump subunit AcrA (membrane-fusion protein)